MHKEVSELSDQELIENTESLVRRERELTEAIVRHLAELDDRRLYAKLGYSSLFAYATRALHYSEGSAMRRIKAARLGKEHPEILDYLEKGELSLQTVSIAASVIGNSPDVIEELRGKSTKEAEKIAAKYNPVSARVIADSIKPIVVGSKDDSHQSDLWSGEITEEKGRRHSAVAAPVCVTEPVYQVTFSASERCMVPCYQPIRAKVGFWDRNYDRGPASVFINTKTSNLVSKPSACIRFDLQLRCSSSPEFTTAGELSFRTSIFAAAPRVRGAYCNRLALQ